MSGDIERIFRDEFGRVVASLTRRFGDLDVAEEAAGEALLAALERWPVDGVPPNPGGWLTTTAVRRAIDRIRREQQRDAKHQAALMIHDDTPHEPTGAGRRRPPPARSSPVAIRRWRPRPGSHSPCGCSAGSRSPRSRPRSWCRDDDGAAHHPRQGQDQGRAHPLPGALGGRPRRAARRRADRGLPRVQRGLPGQRGRRPDPGRADRRGDPARPGAASRSCPTRPRSRAFSR